VLETLLAEGVDVYSAIEIADNAGRTPIFEAVENLNGQDDNELAIKIIQILTQSKQQGGFAANPNVINYNGQTPLFSAARQGSFYAVKSLIEAGAKPDLHNGELVKPEED
jgi:ankyrin repeat protein